MKTIKILGTGCPKCIKTTDIVEKAAKAIGTDVTIEKVEELSEIMKYNIMSTPGLVIDENVVMNGRVPKQKDVETLLKA